ncbi:MAG: hypothetical protein ABR962_00130 [Candidatus Bathyarchaeia archaeon]
MPLTESVSFKAVLQRENRIQVPRLIRWQYKMEACEVLRVNVRVAGGLVDERFLARMTRDGRLTIPKLTLKLLREGEEQSLEGCVLEVTVEPAHEQGEKPESNP